MGCRNTLEVIYSKISPGMFIYQFSSFKTHDLVAFQKLDQKAKNHLLQNLEREN